MTRVLVHAYDVKRDHLDAYDVEALIVPAIVDEKTWVPELDREDLLYHRLFLAEKWLVLKLRYGHADPRDAGVGNIVNCGAAMYIAPVGIANAGDPDGAYAEAIDLTAAHQSSYGREAAGVLAAAVAEAMRLEATPETVVETCLRLAKDGTRTAIEAVAEAAGKLDGWREGGLAELGRAFSPFDSVGEHYATPALNARIPSRLHSIEELPIAIGLLVATGGDCEETVLGGVNYGRDSDSIASMGGALAGALGSPLRRDWIDDVSAASKIDVEEAGRDDGRRRGRDLRARRPAPPGAGASDRRPGGRRGACLRVTWVQPEDLVGHELRQAREEGKDVDDVEQRWFAAGGAPAPGGAPRRSRSPPAAGAGARAAGRARRAAAPAGRRGARAFDEILAAADPAPRGGRGRRLSGSRGAWLGRAVGCVLGKPVENIPREGIRAIAQATGNWPVTGWFTAEGLAGGGLGALALEPGEPRRRASPRTSTGSPRTTTSTSRCSVLRCSSAAGTGFDALDVAKIWLDYLPPGRIFTAERSRCGTCSRPTSHPRPRPAATRFASGSGRACG